MLKIQGWDCGLLKTSDIHTIFTDSEGALDFKAGQYAGGAIEGCPAEAFAFSVLADFPGVETGFFDTFEICYDFDYCGCFSAAGEAC